MHWLHLFDLSPVFIFGRICLTSLQCIFGWIGLRLLVRECMGVRPLICHSLKCTALQISRHGTETHQMHNIETHQRKALKHTNAQHWNTTMHITCCFKQQELLPPKVLMSGDWITWLDCIDQVLLLIAFHFSKFYQWFPIFILISAGGLPRWHPHSW